MAGRPGWVAGRPRRLTGRCACAFTTTAAAVECRQRRVVNTAAVVAVGAVGAAAPGRPASQGGRCRSRECGRSRSRIGCAGQGGVCRSGGFAEHRGRCSRPLGVAVLGVCRCGRVHVRCHLLPILRCVLRTAYCQLPIPCCRLGSVGVPGVSFPRVPVRSVCASFGALPPVGVIPSGRSPFPPWSGPSLGLDWGSGRDSTWGIPCEPRAETGPSYGRVVSDPASGTSRPEAWLSLLTPTRLLYGIHIPVRTPIIHHPRNTRITHKTRILSCSTPIRLHPNRNQTRQPPPDPAQPLTSPSLLA